MASSPEHERYALPQQQYHDGDVLIKLGHEQSDWVIVHSEKLSKNPSMLRAALGGRWAKTIGIDNIKHPRTGEDVAVKTIALKFSEGAYFLEGREVVEDLEYEASVFQNTRWSVGWPHVPIREESIDGRPALEMTIRAFKVIITTMHGINLTAEQVAGSKNTSEDRKENIGASAWLNNDLFPQVVTVCAIAEYLDCLDTVGPAMLAVLHSAPRFWQAVAYKPLRYLMLAMKLKNRELFYDAYQHALAQDHHNHIDDVNLIHVAAITNWSVNYHYTFYNQQLRRMQLSAENLRFDLHRLQTGVGRPAKPAKRTQNTWSFLGIIIADSDYDAEAEDKEHYASIGRSIYGRWLAEQSYVQQPGLFPSRYRSEEPNVHPLGPHDAPALRFNLAVHRLEQAAFSNNPTSIFGLSTPRRFASRFPFFERNQAEEGIKEALHDIIKQANIAIERFRNLDLTNATVQEAETEYQRGIICGLQKHRVFPMENIFHITGGAHFDGHDAGYFTCLKLNIAVPFDTTHGESRVFKCEPLDWETLLESQRWMDRVFEPFDEKRRPFFVGTVSDFIYFLKFMVVVNFSLYIGLLLLSL